MMVVGDLADGLRHVLALAEDPSTRLRAQLETGLTLLVRSLFGHYLPEIELDQLLETANSSHGPRRRWNGPKGDYPPLSAPEVLALVTPDDPLAGLQGYPPLAVALCALEALGVVDLAVEEPDPLLDGQGRLVKSTRLPTRAPLLVALTRLTDAFRQAFPQVEIRALVMPAVSPRWHNLPRAMGKGGDCLRDLLTQCRAVGFLKFWQAEAAGQVSWRSKLAFWSKTEAKVRVSRLQERLKLRRKLSRSLWMELWQHSCQAAAGLADVDVQQRLISAVQVVGRIHAESASSGGAQVAGRDRALEAVAQLRGSLREHWKLEGDYHEWLAEACRQDLPVLEGQDNLGVAAIPLEIVRRVVRSRMRRFGQPAQWVQLERLRETELSLGAQSREAAGQIRWWERLNVFQDTDTKARHRRLNLQHQGVRSAVGSLADELHQALVQAVEAFPPLALYLHSQGLEATIEALRAYVETEEVEVGRGQEARTETRYHYHLAGMEDVDAQLRLCVETFLAGFGEVPGPALRLELWVAQGAWSLAP